MLFKALASSLLVLASGLLVAANSLERRATYTNPVKAGGGADPFVLRYGGMPCRPGFRAQLTRP